MLDSTTKRRIDNARDVLVGKIPDPKAQVEQITIALIYKFMFDMDQEAIQFGGKARYFTDDFEQYRWDTLVDTRTSGQQRLNLYSEALIKMSQNPNLPQLFRDIFRGAFLPYRDPETLNLFLKEINGFKYDHSERLGDAYEYLLSVLGSQGDAGQFRTPRHIIDFIVKAVDPQKGETVLDPACGTAGFLISAYKNILNHNMNTIPGDKLTPDEKSRIMSHFVGYDISPDMVRLSRVNMYLHGFTTPSIYEYDTLTNEDKWNETYDIILANPPFMTPKGGIRPHKRFSIQANRSEVLFVDYIAEHLNVNGRAGVIVPEGIIFQSANAYKNLRKMLIEQNYLFAVVSLPAGVFNPYSGVKTSILIMDKNLSKRAHNILFIKIENDGYDLGAQRRELDGKGDIPKVAEIIKKYKKAVMSGSELSLEEDEKKFAHTVLKQRLAESGDYNLSGDRYRETKTFVNHKWPMVELGEVCEIISGQSPEGKFYNNLGNGVPFYQGKTEFGARFINPPNTWTTQITRIALKDDILMSVRAPVGPVNFSTQEICIGRGLAAIRAQEKIDKDYLFYLLRSKEKEIKGSGGAVFDSISRPQIAKIKIPLPPLDVQREIVAELDGYQKIIDGARQVIDNYKPVIKIDPDWPLVELGEVCETSSGGTPLKSNKEYYQNGTISWLKSGEVSQGFIYSTNEKITEKGLKNSSAKLFPINTVLIAMYGATAGQVGLLKIEAAINQAICAILPNQKYIPEFLFWILKSRKEHLISLSVGGAQPNISQQIIKKIQVPLLPLEVQQEIVSRIEEEQKLADCNKNLIEIFVKKVQDKIKEVWGEEEGV